MSSSTPDRALLFPVAWDAKASNATPKPEARDLTDEEILAQIQSGDASSLCVLFDRYSRLVLDIALHVLRDRGEAEEIVQDVFFFVYRRAVTFNPEKGTAKGWIVQKAYHRSLNRRAYLGRRGFFAGTEVEGVEETLSGDENLERDVAARLSRRQLEKAFEGLPEMQRRTFELYYFDGLELREISEKLGEPLGQVRHHYYRGMERLRRSAVIKRMQTKNEKREK